MSSTAVMVRTDRRIQLAQVRQLRSDLEWQRVKYAIDTGVKVLMDPVILTMLSFMAANYLQHKRMGFIDVKDLTWWQGPGWPTDNMKQIPMTVLTDDQANVLRAGIITVAAGRALGGTGGIIDLVKGIVK